MPELCPDSPWCGNVDHPQVAIFLFRCQHRGRITMYVTIGTCDQPLDAGHVDFGPFDRPAEIEGYIVGIIRNWERRAGV